MKINIQPHIFPTEIYKAINRSDGEAQTLTFIMKNETLLHENLTDASHELKLKFRLQELGERKRNPRDAARTGAWREQ